MPLRQLIFRFPTLQSSDFWLRTSGRRLPPDRLKLFRFSMLGFSLFLTQKIVNYQQVAFRISRLLLLIEPDSKVFLEVKSAALSTAISLNSCGLQNFCLSLARKGTKGLEREPTLGRELKNMTRRKKRSMEEPLFQRPSTLSLASSLYKSRRSCLGVLAKLLALELPQRR